MAKRTSKGPSRDRFIDETMALVAEKGGFGEVNLREISRRVGCAHTNVYNYFANLEDLMWAAFDRTLDRYADALTRGLDTSKSPLRCFRALIGNMISFAVDNPGLYRFISSDPINPQTIPRNSIDKVIALKAYFIEVIHLLGEEKMTRRRAGDVGNMLLAYLDGETLNYINGRILPDEDILGRTKKNGEKLFTLLTARTSDGIRLSRKPSPKMAAGFPVLRSFQ
jgi:AcrR family transcriptional regulator